jgi:hypothetical protein
MQVIADQIDHCPYCHNRLEIVCVKFRFSSVATLSVCPNCAVVGANQRAGAELADQHSANEPTREQPATKELDITEAFKWRYRRSLAFMLGAVITAAFLRHMIHVQGGIPPAEIGAGAIVIAAAMVLAMVFLGKRRRP